MSRPVVISLWPHELCQRHECSEAATVRHAGLSVCSSHYLTAVRL